MADFPKGTKIPISKEEWKAFTSWLIQNKQPLPAQSFNGQIDAGDTQYQAWVSTGKSGYIPPPAITKQQMYDPRAPFGWTGTPPSGKTNFSWSPATQLGSQIAPVSPATTPISAEDQAMFDANKLATDFTRWQMAAPEREAAAETIADARLRYREYADWQRKTALNEQNIQANAQNFAWDTAQQRFASKDTGLQNQNAELQRQVNELQFERDRQAMLSGTPSNDWITHYTLQNQPNPYKKQEISPIDQLESNLDRQTASVQKWQAEAVNAANAEATGQPYHITSDQAKEAVANSEKARDALYATWKTVQDESIGWSPQPIPQPYPNAPDWLPQYAPGLQAGQMITKQNVPTPSGQQLNIMSGDQVSQLGYFGKWAGSNMNSAKNILEASNLMQPYTPRGAGRYGWQSSRQG